MMNFILRRSSIVASLYFGSAMLGLLRESSTAFMFGATGYTDAYLIASIIPSLFSGTLGGAISTAFVTVYSRSLAKGDDAGAQDLINSCLSILGAFLLILLAIFLLVTPNLVHLFAPSYNGTRLQVTVALARLIMPTLLFGTILSLLMGVNNARNSNIAPASIGIVSNLIMIFATLVLGHFFGIYGMAVGASIGTVAQVLLQFPSLYKLGFSFRFRFGWRDPLINEMAFLVTPFIVSAVGSQLNLIVDRSLATSFSPGTVSAIYYANKLIVLPQGIIASAIGIVTLPLFSRAAAQENWPELVSSFGQAIRIATLALLPVSIAMCELRIPLVHVMFQRGAFNAGDTFLTAGIIPYFMGVLVFSSITSIVNQMFFALKRIWVPIGSGVLVVCVNITLSIILIHPLKRVGLPLANSISELLKCAAMLAGLFTVLRLHERVKIYWRSVFGFFVRAFTCSILTGAFIYVIDFVLKFFVGSVFIEIVVSGFVGSLFYLVLGALIRIEELHQAKLILQRIMTKLLIRVRRATLRYISSN